MTRSLTEGLLTLRACTVRKVAIPLALLAFIVAPVLLLHWDFWLPATAGRDELTIDQLELALPVDQLLSLRYGTVTSERVRLRQSLAPLFGLCALHWPN